MATSLPSAGLAVVAGFLTVLSPCVLPILPIIIGRSLQSHPYGPVALVLGLIAGFATIGSFLGLTASWFASLASFLRLGAIALLFIAGISTVFPTFGYRISQYFSWGKWFQEPTQKGLLGEWCLGTQLGFLWTPCAGSVLGSILILAAAQGDSATAFVLLCLYGLGAGIPLLGIAYGGRYLAHQVIRLRPYSAIVQKVGGVVVVMSAIAILMSWDVQIQLWLATIFPSLL